MSTPDFASLDAKVAKYHQQMQHTVKFDIAVTELSLSTDIIGGKVIVHFQDGSTMEGQLLEASVHSEGPNYMSSYDYYFAKQQQIAVGYGAGPNKLHQLYEKFAEGVNLPEDFKKELLGEWGPPEPPEVDGSSYTSGEICSNGWSEGVKIGFGGVASGSILALPHQGGGSEIDGEETMRILTDAIPGFEDMMVKFPVEDAGIDQLILLHSAIVTLNDTYRWTREQIASWLETLDLDLTIRPAVDVEGDEVL